MWKTSVGDKCKLMRPKAPRVGDKCEGQVGDKCELMRPKAPRVGNKCGREVGDKCKLMPKAPRVRKVTSTFETSRPTWVSVQDVVLNKLRPSTQPSQPLPELSHFYHNTRDKMFAHVAMVLVGVSLLDTKQMRSRQLASFCQLHKSDRKHMSSQKVFTSRHGLFV